MDRSALVVTGAPDRTALLSTRNIPGVRAVPADVLNVADMLAHRSLVLTVDAVRRAEALWGGDRASGRAGGELDGGGGGLARCRRRCTRCRSSSARS